MADTSIEWTDKVWNPVRGCSLVSHGCTNCYAMKQAHRFSGVGQAYEALTKMTSHGPVWTGHARVVPEALALPLRWRKPQRIFVNSMSDLFHEDVPDSFICAVFALMETAQRHTFQVLTKRPDRMRRLLSHPHFYAGYMRKAGYDILGPDKYKPMNPGWPLPNVWLGVSVEDQKTADERIPILLRTRAAVRWISAEPLLGPIDLRSHLEGHCTLHDFASGFCVQRDHPEVQRLAWVVVGGESGPGARPMHPKWAIDLRDQCVAAGVPFLFKQWGEWAPILYRDAETGASMLQLSWNKRETLLGGYKPGDDHPVNMKRVGKKAAGRVLGDRTWDEYPA